MSVNASWSHYTAVNTPLTGHLGGLWSSTGTGELYVCTSESPLTWTLVGPPSGGPAGQAFPIGSVFLSMVSTDPATLLGYGTWAAIATGQFLVGLNGADTDFDTAGKTGGSKTTTATGTNSVPTFTGSALAAHAHTAGTYSAASTSAGTPAGTIAWPAGVPTISGTTINAFTATINSQGTIAWPVGVPTFTGNAGTSGQASAGTNSRGATASTITLLTHTHSFTPAGTIAWPAGVPTHSGTTINSVTPTINAAGTIAWPAGVPTFSGSSLAGHTHAISNSSESITAGTPAGTVTAPTFTGDAVGSVPPYFVVYMWQRTA